MTLDQGSHFAPRRHDDGTRGCHRVEELDRQGNIHVLTRRMGNDEDHCLSERGRESLVRHLIDPDPGSGSCQVPDAFEIRIVRLGSEPETKLDLGYVGADQVDRGDEGLDPSSGSCTRDEADDRAAGKWSRPNMGRVGSVRSDDPTRRFDTDELGEARGRDNEERKPGHVLGEPPVQRRLRGRICLYTECPSLERRVVMDVEGNRPRPSIKEAERVEGDELR